MGPRGRAGAGRARAGPAPVTAATGGWSGTPGAAPPRGGLCLRLSWRNGALWAPSAAPRALPHKDAAWDFPPTSPQSDGGGSIAALRGRDEPSNQLSPPGLGTPRAAGSEPWSPLPEARLKCPPGLALLSPGETGRHTEHRGRGEARGQPAGDSLVQLLVAGLADAHLLLDAELGDGGVPGGALAAEDLAAGPAVVLGHRQVGAVAG